MPELPKLDRIAPPSAHNVTLRVDRGAERALRKATLRNPRLAGAWAELGNLRMEQLRWAGAIEAYRRAIALGRTDLAERLRLAEAALADATRNP